MIATGARCVMVNQHRSGNRQLKRPVVCHVTPLSPGITSLNPTFTCHAQWFHRGQGWWRLPLESCELVVRFDGIYHFLENLRASHGFINDERAGTPKQIRPGVPRVLWS